MNAFTLTCSIAFLLTGCFDLDGFVHNPRHCSAVTAETCDAESDLWDKVCVPCEQSYDFGASYPWMDGTLTDGQIVRAIPEDAVTPISIPTTDGLGTLDAYFIVSHGENTTVKNTTVIYNHGNYASIEHYIPRLQFLYDAGYNIFVWDYRGYGKSLPDSAPSPTEFMADAQQVREHVEDLVPDAEKLIVYAFSLGGIPAVEMAVHDEPCALFLEAPFTSMGLIAKGNSTLSFADTFFSQGHFNNPAKLDGYPGAVLLMIGTEDIKFTLEDQREVFDGVKGPKEFWTLEGVSHGIANRGIPEAGLTAYQEKMASFLETHASSCLSSP
jgi:hypothetical protein